MTSTLGNGMLLWELYHKRILQHLKLQGIKYIFSGNIEDVMIKIADPFLLGYLIKTNKEIAITCLNAGQVAHAKFGYLGLSENGKVKIYENLEIRPENSRYINSGSCIIELDFIQRLFRSSKFINEFQCSRRIIKRFRSCFNPETKKLQDKICLFFQTYYHDILEYATKIGIVEIKQS